jgi:protein phosphatase
MAAHGIKLSAFGLTDVGRQREHNEDSLVLVPDQGLFVVADGMGGHQAGDVASKLATSLVADFFQAMSGEDATWPSSFNRSLSEEENRLVTGINLANRRIFEQSRQSHALNGMGTTIVGALFSDRRRRVYVGHVGDSRAYRIRGRGILQMTRDHSLYNEPPPHMTESEREELPRNVITRALGMDGNVLVDLTNEDIEVGDYYLLCSDGLSGMVPDEKIHEIVTTTGDATRACEALVAAANDLGGEDNITVVVVKVEAAVDEEGTTQDLGPDTMKQL